MTCRSSGWWRPSPAPNSLKVADYILDLGPEGGDGGGRLVASGTPEEVAQCEKSYTGRYLGPVLAKTKAAMQAKSE